MTTDDPNNPLDKDQEMIPGAPTPIDPDQLHPAAPALDPVVEEQKGAPEEIRLTEDERDGGMLAISEEMGDIHPLDPELADGGMSAGYPVLPEESFPEDPGLPQNELITPAERAMTGAPLFSQDAMELTGIDTKSEALQQKVILDADPEMLKLLVPDQDVLALWARANRAQAVIPTEIHNMDIGRRLLNHIRDGRNEILAGRDHYEEAERFINEVDYQLEFSKSVRKATRKTAWWLVVYLAIFGFLILVALINGFREAAFAGAAELQLSQPATEVDDAQESQPQAQATPTLAERCAAGEARWTDCLGPDMVYLVVTMLWGGLGGVVGGLFSLNKHVSEDQDFDTQHTQWYIISPPMGIAVAAGVYLLLRAGLLSLVSANDIQSPIIIYVLGFLGGFRHNVFTDLVRRILNTFRLEEDQPQAPPPFLEPQKSPIVKPQPPSDGEPEAETS